MIILSLWLHLCYYMIYSNSFVGTVEQSKIGNDQSGVIKQSTRLDGNIKGSNINEINTQEHSHSSEETRDSSDPVSNQSFKTSRPKSDMLIDLDITKTKSTAEFDCSEKGNVVTYTSKPGYGFYVVKEGRSWWSCTGSDKVIWESRFRSQYLNKVVIETGPNEEKTLTIHCIDGTTAVAKKSKGGDFVLQNDDSSKDSKPVDSSPVADAPTDEPSSEKEPTETPAETKDSEDPVSQEYEGLEHDSSRVADAPTAEPSSEEEPTETPAETKDSEDPVSKQKSETSSPVIHKLIDLDINTKKTTSEVVYSKNNNLVTYTPQRTYAFFSVKEKRAWWSCTGSDKVIWDRKNKSEYSLKVVVESGSNEEKTLTIHLVDGTTKVYKTSKGDDFVLQNDYSSKDSKPVDSSPVTDTPTDEPSSEQEPTETSEETKDVADPVSQEYDDSKPVDSSPVTHIPTAEPTSEQEPSETPAETRDSTDPVSQEYDDSKPVESSPVTEAPTDEPRSEQEDSEVSESPESKEDHMTASYQTSDDSKPVDSSPVADAPTDEPSSEKEPTETPAETKDSEDPVSQEYEGLEHDSSRVADAPTDEPSSEKEPTETPAETKDSTDPVSQEYEGLEHDSSRVADAPTDEPSSEKEPTETPAETMDSADPVSQEYEGLEHDSSRVADAPTDEPSSEKEPTETPAETKDSTDPVSQEYEGLEHDSSRVADAPTDEPSSEKEPTETPEETKDSEDPVSQEYEGLEHDSSRVADAPTDEPSSEKEPTETPAETKDSEDPVSKQKSETSIPEVKLIELDIEKTKNTTEFNYSKNNNVVTYTPKPGCGFSTVKIGKGWKVWSSDKVIWHKKYKSQYSNKVVVETGSDEQKTLTIHCVDGTTKVFKKVKDGDFLLTSEVKLVEVDIEKTKNTTEFDYSKNNNVVTYTPKPGCGFSTVKIGKGWKVWNSDKVVWEAENRWQYSNKVVVETGSDEQKTLTIHCVDGTTKVFKKVKDGDFLLQNDDSSKDSKPGGSSAVTDPPTAELKLIDLDIEKSESTGEFNYSSEGKVAVYTAKEGYGFSIVKKGKGSCSCTGSDEIIWEAEDKTQASNKVRLTKGCDGTNTTLCILEIYMVNGSTLSYSNSDSVNSPYYKKWVQKFEDVPKELHPSEIKIYTKDETASEAKENDTSKYKVNIFNEGQSSKYFYYIKKDVKCTQVKYNNDEVWNDNEHKDRKTIDRLTYDTGDNSIVLEYKSTAFKKYKIPDEPKQK